MIEVEQDIYDESNRTSLVGSNGLGYSNELDDVFGLNPPAPMTSTPSSVADNSKGGNILAQLQKLRKQFQVDTSSTTDINVQESTKRSVIESKLWPQDYYVPGEVLCLWSDPNEVDSSSIV